TRKLVTSVPAGGARTNAPGRTVVPVAPPGPDQRTKFQVGRSLSTYKLNVMQQSRQQLQQQMHSQPPRNGMLQLQKTYGTKNPNTGNTGNTSNPRNGPGNSLAHIGGGQERICQQIPAQGSNYQQELERSKKRRKGEAGQTKMDQVSQLTLQLASVRDQQARVTKENELLTQLLQEEKVLAASKLAHQNLTEQLEAQQLKDKGVAQILLER
ncbi:hypothetical protein B484DRAFT_463348, partial [Ochromonadaceae sp. CCMP2298]